MEHAPEAGFRLSQLISRADLAIRSNDAAQAVALWMDAYSLCLVSGLDFNQRLFEWALNFAEDPAILETQAVKDAAAICLKREFVPLAPVPFVAAGGLELRDERADAAFPNFCLAAILYKGLGPNLSRQLDGATVLLLKTRLLLGDDWIDRVMRHTAPEYNHLRRAVRRWWRLPSNLEETVSALLADQIASSGRQGAIEASELFADVLKQLALSYAASPAIQNHFARGLRNAIVAHGRHGRLSLAEEYFAALLRVTSSFPDVMAFQQQLGSSIVSMIHYYIVAAKTDATVRLVTMLEEVCGRFPGSVEFQQLLDQGRQKAAATAQKSAPESSRVYLHFGETHLRTIKAISQLTGPRKLMDLIIGIVDYTPEVRKMERDLSYGNWSADLKSFCDFMSISPLFDVLSDIAVNGLPYDAPALERYRLDHFRTAPWEVFWNASQLAKAHSEDKPHASFVLAVIAAVGWLEVVGDALFENVSMLHPGWLEIPHTLAVLSARLGNLIDTRALAEAAYGMVSAAKTIAGETGPDEGGIRKTKALEDYRRLSGHIYEKYITAIANLSDEVQLCCHTDAENLRAELGALLFTVGYLPERGLMAKGSQYHPSRSLVRRVIEQSLACMPFDPLVQSVWLEIVDSPLVQWNDHRSLELFIRRKFDFRMSSPFPIVEANLGETYHPVLLDSMDKPYSPAVAYAPALIEWFRDPASEAFRSAVECLELSIDYFSQLSFSDNPFVLVRLLGLKSFWGDASVPSLKKSAQKDGWGKLLKHAADGIRGFLVHPECPEAVVNQFNLAVCGFIEEAMAGKHKARKAVYALEKIEELRRLELVPWLDMNPPLRLRQETDKSRELFLKEDELIRDLRGAYFTLYYATLPPHYRLFGIQRSPEDTNPDLNLRPARGRREIADLRKELAAVHAAMKKVAPPYAEERLRRRPAFDDLVECLRSHRHSG